MDVSQYDVIWNTQSKHSGEAMPCGGFDTGASVWTEENDILFYLDRSGHFDENNQMLKAGRIRIHFEENPFVHTFRQQLSLKDGSVWITGDDVQVNIWFEVTQPVCHVDVVSEQETTVNVSYENWRLHVRPLCGEERMAASSFVSCPEDVFTYPDVVTAKESEVLFYHQNRNDQLVFDKSVDAQGLDHVKDQLINCQKDLIFGGRLTGTDCTFAGEYEGSYADVPYRGYRLRSAEKTTHHFSIFLHSEQTPQAETFVSHLCAMTSAADAKQTAVKWWTDFFDRSYIAINDEKGETDTGYTLARNYTLFRYMLGCNAYGKYPTKFNGGLFTTDACFSVDERHRGKTPDFRMWGGGAFTAQNQRLVYWPMLKSGDFDMMAPQFDFYNNLLSNAEIRTREYWGHEGCSFCEQLENTGLSIWWNYGFDNTSDENHHRPKHFDKAELRGPWTRYEYSTQLEFSYMILKYHEYTKADIKQYIPLIESCVRFYFEHYKQIYKENTMSEYDENGKLFISPSTALETYKNAVNPTDAVSGLRAVVKKLCALPQYVDCAYYEELFSHLPQIPTVDIYGGKCIKPADFWSGCINFEIPELYPVFPYEQYGIGRENLTTVIHTWNHVPDGQKDYISWHQDGIFTARMGLTEEAREINTKKLQNGPRRFPAFWGPGHDWVPDHNWGGSGMIGLQDMLVQQYKNTIYVLPAWPNEWDVSFKLHLEGGITIESVYQNGTLQYTLAGEDAAQYTVIDCLHQ